MSAAARIGVPGAARTSPSDSPQLRTRAWRGLLLTLLLVLLLHMLFLRGVSRMLPDMPQGMAGEDAGRVFSTRSIRIANRELALKAPAPQELNKASKPVATPIAPPAANTGLPGDPSQGNTVRFGSEAAPLAAPNADEAAAPPVTAASGATTSSTAPAAPEAPPASMAAAAASAPLAAAASASVTTPAAADAALALAQVATPKGTVPPAYNYVFPPSVRLKYDVAGIVKGFKYFVSGDLSWLHEGGNYTARLEISHFLFGSRVQTSKGAITARGLEPLRFGEKVRSEVAAHFERDKGKVSFSANTPDVPLLPLAQDQVSIFVQLAAMFAADGQAFAPGSKLSFQTIGARGAEDWDFLLAPPERLKIQGKEFTAYKLVREHRADYDTRAELWLAPELEGMPLRIRLTQTSGDEIDMVWTRSQKP